MPEKKPKHFAPINYYKESKLYYNALLLKNCSNVQYTIKKVKIKLKHIIQQLYKTTLIH